MTCACGRRAADRRAAVYLNDLQNHRTETQHEDALITKVFFFQFANS